MPIFFQVAVLVMLPPLILALSRRAPGGRRIAAMTGCIGLAAVLFGATIIMVFGLVALGNGFSYDTWGTRLVWLSINPLQNAVFVILIAAIVVLARRYDGTLLLWILTVGVGYFALWFGLGALPAEGDAWPLILLTVLLGVLAAVVACVVDARLKRVPDTPVDLSWRRLALWVALTGASALVGVLVAWSIVLSGAFHYAWVKPGEPDLLGTSRVIAGMLVIGAGLYAVATIWAANLARPKLQSGSDSEERQSTE